MHTTSPETTRVIDRLTGATVTNNEYRAIALALVDAVSDDRSDWAAQWVAGMDISQLAYYAHHHGLISNTGRLNPRKVTVVDVDEQPVTEGNQVTMTPLTEVDEADLCICGNVGDVECRKPLNNGEVAVWVTCMECMEPSVTRSQEGPKPKYQVGDVLKVQGERVGTVTVVIPMNTRRHGETFVYEADGWFQYWEHEID